MIKRIFDSSNLNWRNNPESNRAFLTALENYCNVLLSYQGYVLLSKVYEQLDIPLTKKEELTAGWTAEDGPIRFNPNFSESNAELEFNARDIADHFED